MMIRDLLWPLISRPHVMVAAGLALTFSLGVVAGAYGFSALGSSIVIAIEAAIGAGLFAAAVTWFVLAMTWR